jgi:hypothetical protein
MKVTKLFCGCIAWGADLLYLQDCELGDCLKLPEIQKLVDNDPNMQNLSKAKRKEFLDDLQLHRDTKKTGACSSNAGAVVDCQACIIKMSTEVCTL